MINTILLVYYNLILRAIAPSIMSDVFLLGVNGVGFKKM